MSYIVLIAALASAVALAALSLSLLSEDLGETSLCHGGFAATGAYVVVRLSGSGWITGPFTEILVALLAGAIAGLVSAPLVARLQRDAFVLGSLALQLGAAGVLRNWAWATNGNLGLQVPTTDGPGVLVESLTALAVGVVGIGFLRSRAIIVLIHAARARPLLFESLGGSTRRIRTFVIVLSAAGTAVGGMLYGRAIGFLHPDAFGLELSLLLLTVVIIGRGSVVRLLAASVGVVLVPEIIRLVPVGDLSLGPVRQIAYFALTAAAIVLGGTDRSVRRVHDR